MRPVAIIGAGSTPFGKLEGRGIVELAVEACTDALEDSHVPREKIQAFYLGNYVGERVANTMRLIEVQRGDAGVEKMSSSPTAEVTAALSTAGDDDGEMRSGLTFPGAFAMIMQEHMALYGTTREQIALVSVKNHNNGVSNPKAQFRKPTNLEEVLTSRLITDPIRLFDCPPISDGAAAVVLCPADIAAQFHSAPVRILGSGHASGPTALTDMEGLTSFPATVRAAREAYAMAGLGPSDIELVEVHDCFTIAEIVATEDLGFFAKGEGGPAIEAGVTQVGGRLPVNPSGGLIAKGHPVGATGVAQVYELVQQLRGRAANQVKEAEVALAHNLGGTGAVSTVHILGRV